MSGDKTGVHFCRTRSKGDHQVFVAALDYAHPKPSFRSYEEWAAAVGDALGPVWTGEADLTETLDAIKAEADATLAK